MFIFTMHEKAGAFGTLETERIGTEMTPFALAMCFSYASRHCQSGFGHATVRESACTGAMKSPSARWNEIC